MLRYHAANLITRLQLCGDHLGDCDVSGYAHAQSMTMC